MLLAACGGSSNNTASNSPSASPSPSKEATISSVDACKLVTAADASTAAGTTVTNLAAGAGVTIPGACVYSSADSSATVFVYAQTYADTNAAQQVSPDQIVAALNGQYGVSNAKAVAGIGDKAFEYTANAAGSSGVAIFVFKSNVVLMVLVSPSTDANKVEELARTAVSRL
jgi:hypothetical protein